MSLVRFSSCRRRVSALCTGALVFLILFWKRLQQLLPQHRQVPRRIYRQPHLFAFHAGDGNLELLTRGDSITTDSPGRWVAPSMGNSFCLLIELHTSSKHGAFHVAAAIAEVFVRKFKLIDNAERT